MSRQFILRILNAICRRFWSLWNSIIEMFRLLTRRRRPPRTPSISSAESATSSTLTLKPVLRKKALLIGINYPNHKEAVPLKKSHADCEKVKTLLLDLHYVPERITMMMDDDHTPPELQPTYENIRTQLSLLVKDARPGDHFCLFFTGHGSHEDEEGHPPEQEVLEGYTQRAETIPSTNGDSSKGYLVPCDSKWTDGLEDVIHVKDLKELLIDKLPNGTSLISVIDCCNGGALMGLPYKWRGSSCVEPCIFNHCQASPAPTPPTTTDHLPGRALCISACGDRETTYEHDKYGGLLVQAILEGYYRKTNIKFHELFVEIYKRYDEFRDDYKTRTKKSGEDFPTFEISSSQPWVFPDSVRLDGKRFLWMDINFSCLGLGEGR